MLRSAIAFIEWSAADKAEHDHCYRERFGRPLSPATPVDLRIDAAVFVSMAGNGNRNPRTKGPRVKLASYRQCEVMRRQSSFTTGASINLSNHFLGKRLKMLSRKKNVVTTTKLIYRHSVVTRVAHWINVLCMVILLSSGLQILNAYPTLNWGQIGADADPYVARIESKIAGGKAAGDLKIAGRVFDTTGVLGASEQNGQWVFRAFPSWATLPSHQDLATGRRWHFFFAWLFVANGLIYLGASVVRRHFTRDLVPTAAELRPRHLWREVLDHARLRFPEGEAARNYNSLQKITYLVVIAVLLPLMVLTGLTMSPAMDAAVPFLLDLFGGRPSARTIHFITASLLVTFVVVHVLMVLLSGVYH